VVVAAETTGAYAEICALGEELDVAHRSLDVVSSEADITRQQFEAGAGSSYDVDRAQALVAQTRASIPQLEGERRAALFELTALLGRTPSEAPKGVEACHTPPHLTSLIPVGDGRALIRRRPDVRQAERRLAVATAEIGVATADLYPTIRLGAFFGGAALAVSQLNTNAGRASGFGPSISWTFPNQAAPRARVRQAKASEVAALASFDSVVLTALKETEQALTSYSSALANRQDLGAARDKIRSAFDIARNGYAAGSLSTLDLLTTEQSLVSLEAAVAAEDATLIQDQVAIFKALGGGWQPEDTPR
jgi:NodT family efflux transporter outer membrane factor (OMF) lipoprotein